MLLAPKMNQLRRTPVIELTKENVIAALKEVLATRSDEDYGICWNLKVALDYNFVAYAIVVVASRGWGKATKNPDFPIPCEGDPYSVYLWEGTQYELRCELIGYMIARLESGKVDLATVKQRSSEARLDYQDLSNVERTQ